MALFTRRSLLRASMLAPFLYLYSVSVTAVGRSSARRRSAREVAQLTQYQRWTNLRPFRREIDLLVMHTKERRLKFGFGWHRVWVNRYIENYVLEHGVLPEGKHSIGLYWGSDHYSGGFETFPPREALVGLRFEDFPRWDDPTGGKGGISYFYGREYKALK